MRLWKYKIIQIWKYANVHVQKNIDLKNAKEYVKEANIYIKNYQATPNTNDN